MYTTRPLIDLSRLFLQQYMMFDTRQRLCHVIIPHSIRANVVERDNKYCALNTSKHIFSLLLMLYIE